MTEQYDAHPERRKGIPNAEICVEKFGSETYLNVMYNNGVELNEDAINEVRRRQGSRGILGTNF